MKESKAEEINQYVFNYLFDFQFKKHPSEDVYQRQDFMSI